MEYSIPDQYYSNYNFIFPGEFYNFPTPPATCPNGSGIAMCNQETLPFFNNNEELNMLPLISSDINSPISSASLPEQLGVSDMAMQALPKGYRGFCDFGAASGGFECSLPK
ncbi:uncharacterized protein Fot_39505 [Forsythia ovata]|uniref:Uncharacterized protein n=1 Tax=Forsythia ovata TaxID=205694 RepID=A0ABD1S5M4_9LAMI